jgi:hypothetical protein
MWPLFLIGGVVIVGGWLWGASKVAGNAPPLTHDTFTSTAKIQVGDIVTVSAASAEPVDNETDAEAPAPPGTLSPNITPGDFTAMSEMNRRNETGEVASFKVTATGLLTKGGTGGIGNHISIGVLVEPALSFRLPVAFLDASVRSVTRNGKLVG